MDWYKPDWSFQVRRAETAIRQLLEGDKEGRGASLASESAEDSAEEDPEAEESKTDSGNLTERLRRSTIQGAQAALAAGLAAIAGELLSRLLLLSSDRRLRGVRAGQVVRRDLRQGFPAHGAAVFGRSRVELDHLTTALMALDLYARRLTDLVGRETRQMAVACEANG